MQLIEQFSSVRVLCVGDVMLDRFVDGAVKRISPESPVPVLFVTGTTIFGGGASNVARNITALGGKCTVVGVVGNDAAAIDLERLLAGNAGITPDFIKVDGRPTTEKTRFVAHGQHMLRADIEDAAPIDSQVEARVLLEVERHIHSHHAVVLSDYAKGVLTDAVVSGTIALARKAGIPVIVDPKSKKFARYNGATIVTPNIQEVLVAVGIEATDDVSAIAAGQQILAETTIETVLITRSEKGMTLVSRDAMPLHIKATAREVADVVGAGDTVVATLALALGARGELADAAKVANAAAAVVVGKRGTATTSQTELLSELKDEGLKGLIAPQAKVLPREDIVARVHAWRKDGLKVGFTNGCFDILHLGHISILEFARAHCDRLVVGANTDASVRRLKGPSRPINSEGDRALMLAALSVVDAVTLFGEETPKELIDALEPDVLVKGSDYTVETVVGADRVLARGGEVLLFDLVPGRSTTKTIEKAMIGKPEHLPMDAG